jgi:hypothetical protein
MKKLSDGTLVSDRSYYFLLDWNENDNWGFLKANFNKNALNKLIRHEYQILWLHATTTEFNKI